MSARARILSGLRGLEMDATDFKYYRVALVCLWVTQTDLICLESIATEF
jgi:hypothetical protein